MINKIYYTLVCLCLLVCIGCQDNKQREFNIKMLDNDSRSEGGVQGWKDGSNGFAYGYGYDDKLKGFTDVSEQEREEYQEHYSKGYKIGYDQEYNKAKKEYDSKHKVVQTNGSSGSQNSEVVTMESTPNTYPSNPSYSPDLNSGSFHSEERIYSNYFNYKETSDCVEGVVVYEGDDDYYIVETRRGYTVLERRSGSLWEGHKVRGELNRYGTKYLFNRNRDSEVRVYIEDYALSEDDALEWMGENDHLKDEDQEIYDANNN